MMKTKAINHTNDVVSNNNNDGAAVIPGTADVPKTTATTTATANVYSKVSYHHIQNSNSNTCNPRSPYPDPLRYHNSIVFILIALLSFITGLVTVPFLERLDEQILLAKKDKQQQQQKSGAGSFLSSSSTFWKKRQQQIISAKSLNRKRIIQRQKQKAQ